jgi:sugar phosphate permease
LAINNNNPVMNSISNAINNKIERPGSQAFIIATAFLSLLAIVGFTLYGLPLFYDFWIKEFGWTREIVTRGNAVGKIVVAPLFGFIAGWMIDRYGPRRLMITGILLTGAALIGLSLMSSLFEFYSFYILIALGYVFGGPLPCQVLISRWFDKNRGKAMGIAYLGIGTGFVLVPQISAGLEKNFGWHFALIGLGILVMLIALPFSFFVKDPAKYAQDSTGNKTQVSIKEILKNRNFYLLALGSMCSIAAVGGTNQHLKLYLRDIDFSQAQAANIISLVGFSSLAGRLIMGWLSDIFSRKNVMILIYLLVGSAIPLLLLPEFTGRIYLFAVVFGLGLGGDYLIIPLVAGDLFGVKTLGRVMGIVLVADGVAEATSPWMVGALYNEAAKSYTTGFIVLICIALTGALIVSFLPKTGNTRS